MTNVDRNSERPTVRDGVVETFREAAATNAKAERAYEDAQEAYEEAHEVFVTEVESTARWQVRRAHADWFHPNGKKRGAFRQQIEHTFQTNRYELWVSLFPKDRRVRVDHTEPPFSLPRPRMSPEEERTPHERHTPTPEEAMASLAHYEEGILAQENDPVRRERFVQARARRDAFRSNPHGDDVNAVLHELLDAEMSLTVPARCIKCGETGRVTHREMNDFGFAIFALNVSGYVAQEGDEHYTPYTCPACQSAARREKLRVGREARQQAQRRAQLTVLGNDEEHPS